MRSTGEMAIQAMQDDPEILELILAVGRRYPQEHAQGLLRIVIEQTLSTSTLTADYGTSRPGGVEFFKFELNNLLNRAPGS